MSRERTGFFGVVLITVCATSAVLVAGYFGASRYFAQQTVSAPAEETPAPTPAPRAKPGRTKREKVAAAAQQTAVATDQTVAPSAASSAAADARIASEAAAPSAAEAAAATVEPPRAAANEASAVASSNTSAAPIDHADARAIMVETQRRAEANTYRYDGVLESFDATKKLAEKRWSFDRQGSNGRSKAVVRFTAPAEVKGVALLIHNHPDRASDQWMWTPSIERDRRIATQDRSTRFFGTDFSFEDLEERDVDQYDYALLGSETMDGAACWKIKSTPKETRSSQYTHSIAWVRKDNYAVVRLDNFVKDDVIRRLTYTGLEKIQGIWTAREVEVFDMRRHTRTRLSLQQVNYNAAIKEDQFTLQAIRR